MSLGINDMRAIIRAAQGDGGVILAALTTERNALAADMIANSESNKEIISGSGNGVSMNASISFTKSQRMAFLDMVLRHLEEGTFPQSRSYARF